MNYKINFRELLDKYGRIMGIRENSKVFKIFSIAIPIVVFMIIVSVVWIFPAFQDSKNSVVIPGANKNLETKNISHNDSPNGTGEYDYTEALDHIGERATVKGRVIRVFTAKSGVTFLDFCESFNDCPFSAVIFASDLKKFPDISKFERDVSITGIIKSYQGKAEIILNNPDQIK